MVWSCYGPNFIQKYTGQLQTGFFFSKIFLGLMPFGNNASQVAQKLYKKTNFYPLANVCGQNMTFKIISNKHFDSFFLSLPGSLNFAAKMHNYILNLKSVCNSAIYFVSLQSCLQTLIDSFLLVRYCFDVNQCLYSVLLLRVNNVGTECSRVDCSSSTSENVSEVENVDSNSPVMERVTKIDFNDVANEPLLSLNEDAPSHSEYILVNGGSRLLRLS